MPSTPLTLELKEEKRRGKEGGERKCKEAKVGL